VVRVRIDGAVLDWLSKHYRGKFNPDDLASVGALIGEILEISAACRCIYADRRGAV
jgi:hypothetical protein